MFVGKGVRVHFSGLKLGRLQPYSQVSTVLVTTTLAYITLVSGKNKTAWALKHFEFLICQKLDKFCSKLVSSGLDKHNNLIKNTAYYGVCTLRIHNVLQYRNLESPYKYQAWPKKLTIVKSLQLILLGHYGRKKYFIRSINNCLHPIIQH